MSLFDKLVNRETVSSLGVPTSLWTDEHQACLHEGMILAMKENPDWTEEEVRKEIKRQVESLLHKKSILCKACERDVATLPNEYGPQALGDRVCADCFWDFRKEYPALLHQSQQTDFHSICLHAFCQTCGEHVSACSICQSQRAYHLGHCKDCYKEFRIHGRNFKVYYTDKNPLFQCEVCESKDASQ